MRTLQSFGTGKSDWDFSFPISRNDAFSGAAYESLDIGFEEAAILFNISALHTILGAKERRIEADVSPEPCSPDFPHDFFHMRHLKLIPCSNFS